MIESYTNSIEHILDELKLLDIQLNHAKAQFEAVNKNHEWNKYSGLYVSEEEIDSLLKKKPTNRNHTPDFVSYDNELYQDKIKLEQVIEQKKKQTLEQGINLSMPKLAQRFHLKSSEVKMLIICLAPEIDSKYEKIYAYLQNDVTKKRPNVELILNLLSNSPDEKLQHRASIFQSALFKSHILEFDDSQVIHSHNLSRPLKLDQHVVNFLLGNDEIDPRIASFTKLIYPQQKFENFEIYEELKKNILEYVQQMYINPQNQNIQLLFYFHGQNGTGKKTVAKYLSSNLGKPMIICDIGNMKNSSRTFEEISTQLFLEARMHETVIYLDHFDLLFENDEKSNNLRSVISKNMEDLGSIIIAAGESAFEIDKFPNIFPNIMTFPPLSTPERKKLWDLLLKDQILENHIDTSELANKFRFTVGRIKDAILTAKNTASLRNQNKAHDAIISTNHLYEGCRNQSNNKLISLAQKVHTNYHWNDIILPKYQKTQLKEIASYVKHKNIVFSDWGFEKKLSLGKGLNILFAGESGTGKTMTSTVIANELNLDLYKIDLSAVVSKYIGETEKNLDRIFKEAETSNAILFFDEADALFGKRSEVKDAHDRYANIEINYLLQKLEEHKEIVILASNMASNIDDAFVRRMNFRIEFPFPDEKNRLLIWKNIFPKNAPLDSNIDFDLLAKQFQISGGIIKNVAVLAAFFAAESESKYITTKDLIKAIVREFKKMGKPCLNSDFGKFADMLNTMEN